jgi:hypothetical protein
MKFDAQWSEMNEKAKKIHGLMKVLREIELADDRLAEEPERRSALPYEGERTIRSSRWQTA